ncbi:unnamed protein product [Meloidogyne enterolobii]|uniref:Uncharacterized protein n=1 Tax=Meloidogyne enterolobii TaxID=390850 RepID=A0ACB1AB30_MELEN
MDQMSGNKDVINWNNAEKILIILKNIREKIAEKKIFKLYDLIKDDMEKIIKRDKEDAVTSYHPMLEGNTIDDYIRELNKNTIRDLMVKNGDFKQKIMGTLS